MRKIILVLIILTVLPISLVFLVPINILMGILFFTERKTPKPSLVSKAKFYGRISIMGLKEYVGLRPERSFHGQWKLICRAFWDFLTLSSWLMLVMITEWEKKIEEIESYSSSKAAGTH